MRLGEVVKAYRQQNKLSMESFANNAKISKGYVSMLERGINPQTKKRIAPTLDVMNKLASAMGITLDDLVSRLDPDERITTASSKEASPITRIYDQLSEERQQNVYDYAADQLAAQTHPQKIVQFKVPKPIHYTDVTIYGTVSAGTGEFQADEDQREVVRYPGRVPGHDYALRVNGNSMYPMLEDDQVIFVRRSNGSDVHTGQIVIALLNTNAFVKKIDLDEGQVRLISLNPDYPPIEVDEDDDFQIQGILVL